MDLRPLCSFLLILLFENIALYICYHPYADKKGCLEASMVQYQPRHQEALPSNTDFSFQCKTKSRDYGTTDVTFIIASNGTSSRLLVEITVLSLMTQVKQLGNKQIIVVGTGPNPDTKLCHREIEVEYFHCNSDAVDRITAWRAGLNMIRGRWIIFSTAGDYFIPGFMNRVNPFLDSDNSIILLSYLPKKKKYRPSRCYIDALGECEMGSFLIRAELAASVPIQMPNSMIAGDREALAISHFIRSLYLSTNAEKIVEVSTNFVNARKSFCHMLFLNDGAPFPPIVQENASQSSPVLSFGVAAGDRRVLELRLALLNFQQQDNPEWEAIVVQTSKGEEKAEKERVLKKFFSNDPRIRYLVSEDNAKYGHACREMTIKAFEGKWLLLSNDDNYYAPILVSEIADHSKKFPTAKMLLFDSIHNYLDYEYMWVSATLQMGRVDMGQLAVESTLAKQIGFAFRELEADFYYFRSCFRLVGPNAFQHVALYSVLFCHN